MSCKDNNLKSCFIHIPKNAGMSIETVISGCGHDSVSDLFGNDGKDSEGWNISAIVRNPYDRAVSVWAHGLQVSDAPFQWPVKFSDYVSLLSTRIWQVHARPQYSFLITKAGLGGKGKLFLGRFENMPEAYNMICTLHGIENPPELPHVNPSEHRHWRDYYTYDLIQAINWLYWEDFAYFNYHTL